MAHPTDDIVGAMRSSSREDRKIIQKAYDFAEKAHGDEKRKSGEPYIVHPHAIALYLAELGMDRDTIVAGILHDTTEDTDTPIEAIEKEFGSTVAFLVHSLTKLSKLKYRGLERHVESLRRLLVATASDLRVIIIKMADRLHNMKTLKYVQPKEKCERIAKETMEVYVPIAERLGMGTAKSELEDLAFKVLDSKHYDEMAAVIAEKKKEMGNKLEEDIKDLKRQLGEHAVRSFRTEYRFKGVHSLYKKLQRKEGVLERVYDIVALRIIVRNVEDCYLAFAIIHRYWRPLPGRIKDFTAAPKPNGYRSLHTTVVTRRGATLEVQIRTEVMHREAQFGVASHFYYKAGKVPEHASAEWIQNLLVRTNLTLMKKSEKEEPPAPAAVPRWLKDLTEIQKDVPESEQFREILEKDFFAERMFVFTPKSDVIDLPQDATPIDFAYSIHSDLGDMMVGAKVNGKLVAYETTLKNGDIVEIITRKTAKPNKKWLELAKTANAKSHIRSALRKRGELD